MGGNNSKGTLEEELRQLRRQATASTEFSQKPTPDAANSQHLIQITAKLHPLRPTANRQLANGIGQPSRHLHLNPNLHKKQKEAKA